MFGYVALGHQWLRSARVSHERLAAGGHFAPVHYEAKLATARFYFTRMLPQVHTLYASITAGVEPILAFPMEAY